LGEYLRRQIIEAKPDTIIHLQGHYSINERLTIDKPLSLIGVRGKSLLDCAMCFELKSQDQLVIRDVNISRPEGIAGALVEIRNGRIDISGCNFYERTHPLYLNGIIEGARTLVLGGSLTGTVADCDVRRSDKAITVTDRARPELVNNKLLHNRTAILYEQEAGGTARDNICCRNERYGIEVNYNAVPELEKNFCERNRLDGIRYSFQAKGGKALGNECNYNEGYGISYISPSRLILENNNCRGNGRGDCRILEIVDDLVN